MVTLTRARQELFRRTPDETFESLEALHEHCRKERNQSADAWQLPQTLLPEVRDRALTMAVEDVGQVGLNDWSFSQLCRLAGVSKETVNRFSPQTATSAFRDTLPTADKPIQLLANHNMVRSIHGVSYTRLWNDELLDAVREVATDFRPPQTAFNGGTGLYCGEQDMFAFLVDPTGWVEVGGEAFAPGFFVWNSEVGRRSLGIQSFWFQRICKNHLVWDAVEVVDFSRKHTANVREGLVEIQRQIGALVAKRDARRDQFADVLKRAMSTRLGHKSDEVAKELAKHGIPHNLIADALKIAESSGGFTIFSLVDALTRLTQQSKFIADRAVADFKVGQLLSLALAV